jgi:hypothetical protein
MYRKSVDLRWSEFNFKLDNQEPINRPSPIYNVHNIIVLQFSFNDELVTEHAPTSVMNTLRHSVIRHNTLQRIL